MALSLILRNATKLSAFRSVYRPAFCNTNVAFASQICSRSHQTLTSPLTKSQIIPTLHKIQVRGAHMDHGLLWTVEKAMSVGLLVIVPLTFISPSFLMDNLFAITAVLHNHWGLEAVVIDYVRPVLFGNTIPKIALFTLYAISAIVLAGLLSFNMNDIGIGKAVNKLWRIRDKQ